MGMEWSKDRPCLQTCGSPDYAAPEIFQKKPYFGPEVDIWSMGIILYAMVTGRFAFPGETPFDIAFRVSKGVYIQPTGSAPLCNLIAQMLTVSQTHRITIGEILRHAWFQGVSGELSDESLAASDGSLRASKWKADIFATDGLTVDSKPIPSALRNSRSGIGIAVEPTSPSKSKSRRSHRRERRGSVIEPPVSKRTRAKKIGSGIWPLSTNPSGQSSSIDVLQSENPIAYRPRRMSLVFWKKNFTNKGGSLDQIKR